MGEKNAEVDLFGEPVVPARERRGRKAHERTAQLSKKIAISRARGATVEEIAELVCLDTKTLKKYYSRELDKAPELVEALLHEAIFEQAVVHGRVGAQRLLQEMLLKGKAAVPLPKQSRSRSAPKAQPKGKKEQALEDAQVAHKGTAWGNLLN